MSRVRFEYLAGGDGWILYPFRSAAKMNTGARDHGRKSWAPCCGVDVGIAKLRKRYQSKRENAALGRQTVK